MRPQAPVAVEIDGRGVVVGLVLHAAQRDRAGIRHHVRRIVVGGVLHREHPHEGPALLDVGIDVVEIDAVAVGRIQIGITLGDILGVRYVGHVLQVGDRRVVGIGRYVEPQRILAVDVQLSHHEIGHVVVRMPDLVGVVPHDLPVERRTLIKDIGDERIALLRIAEAGTCALRQVVAPVGVRKRSVGLQSRDRIIRAGDIRLLVALLIIVRNAVLKAYLRIFGDGFRVGELSAQAVAARRREVAQVAQARVARRVPSPRRVDAVGPEVRKRQHVREGVRVVGVVRVVHVAVDGDRTAVLAQFGAINGVRPHVVTVAQGVAAVLGAAVTAFAELPALRRAQRVVRLVAEARTDHQILVVGDFPLQTGVEAVVIRLGIRVAARRERIHGHRRLVPFVDRRTVSRVGIVEEIAALKRHLIALAPRIGVVYADGVHRRHAALGAHHILAHAAAASAPRTARNAQNILEREVLLVDVVEQADDRHAAAAAEDIGVAAHDVFVLGFGLGVGVVTVTGIELAELPLTHVGVRNNVEGLVALAVVHARKFGRVAQLVIDLHTVHGLRRKRLDGRRHVLAEELLAVDENLLDLLALRLDRTVRHGDAGHLLQQPLDVGVVGDLEGSGVVTYRIALLRGAQRLGLLDDRFDLHAGLEFDPADVLFAGRHPEGGFVIVVTEEGDGESVFVVGQRRNRHGAFIAGSEILFLIRSLDRSDLQHGSGNAFAGIGVKHRSADRTLLGECGHGEKQE